MSRNRERRPIPARRAPCIPVPVHRARSQRHSHARRTRRSRVLACHVRPAIPGTMATRKRWNSSCRMPVLAAYRTERRVWHRVIPQWPHPCGTSWRCGPWRGRRWRHGRSASHAPSLRVRAVRTPSVSGRRGRNRRARLLPQARSRVGNRPARRRCRTLEALKRGMYPRRGGRGRAWGARNGRLEPLRAGYVLAVSGCARPGCGGSLAGRRTKVVANPEWHILSL